MRGAPGTAPQVFVPQTRLNAAVNAVLKQKDFVARLRATGAEPYGGTAEAYGVYLKSETARWKTVVQQAGVTPQ